MRLNKVVTSNFCLLAVFFSCLANATSMQQCFDLANDAALKAISDKHPDRKIDWIQTVNIKQSSYGALSTFLPRGEERSKLEANANNLQVQVYELEIIADGSKVLNQCDRERMRYIVTALVYADNKENCSQDSQTRTVEVDESSRGCL